MKACYETGKVESRQKKKGKRREKRDKMNNNED